MIPGQHRTKGLWRQRLPSAPRGVWIVLALAWSAEMARAQSSVSALGDPGCSACRWELSKAPSVLEALHDADLWFGRISDISFDATGAVYVTDGLRHDVVRANAAGGTSVVLGREGEGPGEFRLPFFVASAAPNEILVYDLAQNRFSLFDTTGAYLDGFRSDELPLLEFLAVDDDHHVFVVPREGVQSRDRLIYQLDFAGHLVGSIPDPTPDAASQRGLVWWDRQSGTLWFSRKGPRVELLQFRHDGTLVRHVRGPDTFLVHANRMQYESEGGRVTVRARRPMGTIALFGLQRRYVVNVARIDETGRVQYDVLRVADGAYMASWIEPDSAVLVSGSDDAEWASGISAEIPDVLRFRVRFTAWPNRPPS